MTAPDTIAAAAVVVALILAGCGTTGPGPERHGSPATDVSASPAPSRGRVGTPAASQPTVERPQLLVLPSGAMLPVDRAHTDAAGRLTLPVDVDRAGWWDGGARIGDLFGAIVLAAHVDSLASGIGPIAELLGARSGDRLTLASGTLVQRFEIRSVNLVPRVSLASDGPLLSFAAAHRLVVITCGGPFAPHFGGYRDNLVVVATPSGPPSARQSS